MKGTIDTNGSPDSTVSGVTYANVNSWREDVNPGIDPHFGHRAEPGDSGDVYSSPDRQTGTDYQMHDRAGFEILSAPWFSSNTYRFHFDYWLMVVNITTGAPLSDPTQIPASIISKSKQFSLNGVFVISAGGSIRQTSGFEQTDESGDLPVG